MDKQELLEFIETIKHMIEHSLGAYFLRYRVSIDLIPADFSRDDLFLLAYKDIGEIHIYCSYSIFNNYGIQHWKQGDECPLLCIWLKDPLPEGIQATIPYVRQNFINQPITYFGEFNLNGGSNTW